MLVGPFMGRVAVYLEIDLGLDYLKIVERYGANLESQDSTHSMARADLLFTSAIWSARPCNMTWKYHGDREQTIGDRSEDLSTLGYGLTLRFNPEGAQQLRLFYRHNSYDRTPYLGPIIPAAGFLGGGRVVKGWKLLFEHRETAWKGQRWTTGPWKTRGAKGMDAGQDPPAAGCAPFLQELEFYGSFANA